MTNNDELNYVYRKISVYEMVEKIKSCGIIWSQLNTYQYKTTIEQNNDIWDLVISQMITNDIVVIDFKKNGSYYYTINSQEDPNLIIMFQEIQGDEDFKRDQKLLSDVTTFEGCS